jgi:hypothetical protein
MMLLTSSAADRDGTELAVAIPPHLPHTEPHCAHLQKEEFIIRERKQEQGGRERKPEEGGRERKQEDKTPCSVLPPTHGPRTAGPLAE